MGKLKFTAGLFAGILLLFPAIGMGEAEYYTWVDENGITNYAERNPQGYNARYISSESKFGYKPDPRAVATAPESTTPASEEQSDDGSEVDPDAAIAEEKAGYEAELAEERKHNCRLGKQNLARLETYARIRVTGDDGKQRYLTPEEMATKKKESRDAIKFHCR